MNLEATVGFHFVDDSLIEAGYAFREYYPDPNHYLMEFNRVKLELSHIYGQPLHRNDICSSCRGKASCDNSCSGADNKINMVEWHTTRSKITLILVSDESSTEFGIRMYQKRMKQLSKNYCVRLNILK